ncbi:hypothetical protein [Actinomadura roseirufa]|uniref:hypothetical protein n=1 Tax=Actinomadura roseirufa TaxID=2094049 RepID=UPI00104176BE|nr:hypothetical protein [Actinomadura roseirufa]
MAAEIDYTGSGAAMLRARSTAIGTWEKRVPHGGWAGVRAYRLGRLVHWTSVRLYLRTGRRAWPIIDRAVCNFVVVYTGVT